MNKSTLQERLFAAADWIERVDASPKFHLAVYLFIAFVIGFFSKVIVDIMVR
jgi:hypothetical protein